MRRIVWAESDAWSWIGFVLKNRAFSYLYVPYGPTILQEADLSEGTASMTWVGRAMGLDFVRCEPMGVVEAQLSDAGLLHVESVQPVRTRVVDLMVPETELRSALSSGHRHAVNRAGRHGIEVTISRDDSRSNQVIDLITATASARQFLGHEKSYFDTMLRTLLPTGGAKLGLAEHEGELVSAAIVFDYGNTRGYGHAGNGPEARKLQTSVPLVWQLMMDAKQQGMSRFDLWGIASPDAGPDDPWSGFTSFKRAFGGQDIAYAGAWELPIHHRRYRAFRLAKRAANSLSRTSTARRRKAT